ncbi:unnamed protein product, partial [Ilex paraguariensis]
MGFQLVSSCLHNHTPTIRLSKSNTFSHHTVSPLYSIRNKIFGSEVGLRKQTLRFSNEFKSKLVADMRRKCKFSLLPSLKRGVIVCASDSNPAESDSYRQENTSLVEESKLVLAPSAEGTGSFLWAWAPIALISSLVLPQLFVGAAIDGFFGDEIFSEIVASFASDIFFYIGLATFLFVSDRVQKPYLQFSPKRWGLITGLKGYLTSAFFTMGFKLATWLNMYLRNFLISKGHLVGLSCPLFLRSTDYISLSKATHFIEKLMFAMRGATLSPEVLERNGALVAMIVTFSSPWCDLPVVIADISSEALSFQTCSREVLML